MFLIAGLKYAWNGTVKWKLNGTLSVCSYVVWGYSYSCNWHCLSYPLYRSIYLTVEAVYASPVLVAYFCVTGMSQSENWVSVNRGQFLDPSSATKQLMTCYSNVRGAQT